MSESTLQERYREVMGRVAELTPPGHEVTTVVVTKFHPVEVNRELYELGQRDFGESRHQEARLKVDDPAMPDAVWHFIGQLQSNKARQVARYASYIHSLDRSSLLKALTGLDRPEPLGVFIEVNLTDDPGRGGLDPAALEGFAERVLATDGLRLMGVMGVPGVGDDPARAFERLRGYSELVTRLDARSRYISAGMSQDWPQALAMGATHLRIGTSITGKRAY